MNTFGIFIKDLYQFYQFIADDMPNANGCIFTIILDTAILERGLTCIIQFPAWN